MIRGAAILVVAGLALLSAVVSYKTLTVQSRQIETEPVPRVKIDLEAAAKRLSEAIQIQTITRDGAPLPENALEAFGRFLAEEYPAAHGILSRVQALSHSLLYTWQGSENNLPALVLMAHQDVVPADDTDAWSALPFSGEIRDGYVWGRGALDDKGNLLSIMEAVEHLASNGFTPLRTIHLAFGHDEEIGGQGAKALAKILENEDVGMVLDEGMGVIHDQMPGVKAPIAMIGVSEKGYVTLDLAVTQPTGHSSLPPPHTSVGILSEAIVNLENSPFPTRFQGAPRQLIEFVAAEAELPYRIVFANLWLFRPALEFLFSQKPTTAALLRTTTAATVFRAGSKDNVLPQEASAAVNFRIRPGETVDSVVSRVEAVLDDERVTVSVREGAADPSPVSRVDTPAFEVLSRTVRETLPDALIAPGLMIGATDARHYRRVSSSVFRFSPERLLAADIDRIHGVDERRNISGHATAIRFYIRLIENMNDTGAL